MKLIALQWDEQQILINIRNNNPRGLEWLFKEYYGFLVRTAFYITNDQEVAEDLSQDVFVKIWEKRNNLPEIQNIKAYLTRIVRNTALDYVERNHSQSINLANYLYFEDQITELTQEQNDNLGKEISAAIAKLPPRCRLIFSMNRLEGLTNDEIASYLDISKRTVETQISKALKIIRNELTDVWKNYFACLFL